jgi:hypothetical protein
MSKTEKQKEWSARILKFKKSGKTPEEWCSENNISIRQFNYWFRQEAEISDNIPATKWMSVEIKQDVPINQFLHIKIGVATVEVKPNINKGFLLDVLKTLKAL